MNVVIFMTDQERAVQHFPKAWSQTHLPGMTRLQATGVTFDNAVTNACMCTPARTTWMTGLYPAQHGCKWTLETDMPDDQYPQMELSLEFTNIATVMAAAGYNVIYKGKFHCTKPSGPDDKYVPDDVNQYGFQRWNPQDAGANQDVSEAGGGTTNNDGRFMDDDGPVVLGEEGVLDYINSQAAADAPFCLIVSIVNPHDVLFFPSSTFTQAGYDDSWLKGTIQPPETVDEDLSTKPTVQEQFLRLFNLTGKPKGFRQQKEYINYYGNLMRSSDEYLVQVLDALDSNGLTDDTLIIRTADHGEMGLAHGGLRQKNFNIYEEALRIPLVYSNPQLFDGPIESDHLVSHVDFLPTLAQLFRSPYFSRQGWKGTSYARSVLDPEGARPPQNHTVFTYDDYQSGQSQAPYPGPPNHVVAVREKRWKLARYYDIEGEAEPQYEMYDRKNDPLETDNLAYDPAAMTAAQKQQFKRLKKKLQRIENNALQPLPNTPQPLTPPSNAGTFGNLPKAEG
jgi:arylsulfatase A-like enzyme